MNKISLGVPNSTHLHFLAVLSALVCVWFCRGAVAADGKIQPGDLLLKVNEINFENLTNEEAVKALREVVQQSGPITLTVARPVYDPIEDYNFEPRSKSTCTFYCSFTDDNVRLRIIHLILPGYVVTYVRISVEFVCIQC